MFIRWQRSRQSERGSHWRVVQRPDGTGRIWRHREYVGGGPTDRWIKAAALIRSVRTPAGPRQEYVCYLGSIVVGRGGDESPSDGARWRFWHSAQGRLRKARVMGDDLARVVAALDAVVPRPDGFSPRWDEHWQWLSTRAEIEIETEIAIELEGKVDAYRALHDERAGDAGRIEDRGVIDQAKRGDDRYRRGFWEFATAELDAAGITGTDRDRVVASLERTVPRPAD